MATSDEIGRKRQRVSEQLARLDAERAKLANELNELELTERVLAQFGRTAGTIERRRRRRPAKTAPVAGGAPTERRIDKSDLQGLFLARPPLIDFSWCL